jgi:CRP-like cAMP-binding protein
MNEFENTMRVIKSVESPIYGDPGSVSYVPVAPASTSDMRLENKFHRRIPFNGLLTNKLLAILPGPDFARLLPHIEPVSLAAAENLYAFGECIGFAYFPETAVITHLYLLEDGSRTAATIIGNDGMVGLSTIFNSPAPLYTTQITIAGSAMRIDMEVLKEEFARGKALQQVILNYASARITQLSQKAVCNGRHRLDERLFTWLLMLQDRAGDDQLRLTHEQIAHYLGARRAGITNACNALREKGAIDYHRGTIRILDRQVLEGAACGCYTTFRQISQPTTAPSLVMRKVEAAIG